MSTAIDKADKYVDTSHGWLCVLCMPVQYQIIPFFTGIITSAPYCTKNIPITLEPTQAAANYTKSKTKEK